jgi:hypothetical protein
MSLVIKLNGITFDNNNLPTVATAGFVVGGVAAEVGAVAHYVFGVSQLTSAIDLTSNGHNLTFGHALPVFDTDGVTVSYNATLDTGLLIGSAITLVAVFTKPTSATKAFIVGTFGATSGAERLDRDGLNLQGGAAIYTDEAGISFNSIETGLSTSVGNYSAPTPAYGEPVFSAYSMSEERAICYVPSLSIERLGSVHIDPSVNTGQTIHIGNEDYTTDFKDHIDIHEIIIFDKALTLVELQAVYARSQARMATKSLTI